MSKSPSPSTSDVNTLEAPSASTLISTAVHENPLPPPFESPLTYNTTLLARASVAKMSRSPSLSTSAAWTLEAPSASVVTVIGDQELPSPPPLLSPFRCHTISSKRKEADKTSRSPSPSMSPTATSRSSLERKPPVAIVIADQELPSPPPLLSPFRYHVIVSSSFDAESTSVSPSWSTSAA